MAAVLLTTMAANAQNTVGKFTIAPTVGINFSNVSGDVDDNKMKVGAVFGAVAEYGLLEKLGLSAGVLYSMQGYKEEYSSYGSTEKSTTKLNYLNVPILANYYVIKGLAVKAGLQPAFLLSAKNEDYDIKDHCKTFELSIPVGASYEFKNFQLDARYNIPLTKYNDGDGSTKNSVFQLTLGYKIGL